MKINSPELSRFNEEIEYIKEVLFKVIDGLNMPEDTKTYVKLDMIESLFYKYYERSKTIPIIPFSPEEQVQYYKAYQEHIEEIIKKVKSGAMPVEDATDAILNFVKATLKKKPKEKTQEKTVSKDELKDFEEDEGEKKDKDKDEGKK